MTNDRGADNGGLGNGDHIRGLAQRVEIAELELRIEVLAAPDSCGEQRRNAVPTQGLNGGPYGTAMSTTQLIAHALDHLPFENAILRWIEVGD